MRQVLAIDRDPAVNAAADIAEDALAIDILRGADAAPAADAAIGVERDIGMRRIDRAAGLQIGKLGRLDHFQPVGHGLQFAIAAGLADRAEVVALVKQHLHEVAAQLVDMGVSFSTLARRGRAACRPRRCARSP
jgi:hypothetical protein